MTSVKKESKTESERPFSIKKPKKKRIVVKKANGPKVKSEKKRPSSVKKESKESTESKESKYGDAEDDDADVQPIVDTDRKAKKSTSKKKISTKTTAERFKKQTLLENILARPDTYVGSVTCQTDTVFVYDPDSKKMIPRQVSYVPGLFKIFDEILVNAADHRQRDPTMNVLQVAINEEEGSITVYNNGTGIPVEIHDEYKIYVPELIFGNLLAGENYDDTEERTTGGRNGYGAKLTNIYSLEFMVETYDPKNGKSYKQVWTKNMTVKGKPKVRGKKAKMGWTRITFKPDFAKFGMTGFDKDTVDVLKKRVYDMAGTLPKGTKVKLNGENITLKGFDAYCKLFLTPGVKVAYSQTKNWDVLIAASENGVFEQNSCVNSIGTTKGGNHVDAVVERVSKTLVETVLKKERIKIQARHVKPNLWVFINCKIVNPRFDSQLKTNMTSTRSQFGSKWTPDETFRKKLLATPIVEQCIAVAKGKEQKDFKKNDAKKSKGRLTGIAKLEDANDAGGKNSQHCTLILTEGDSAKALAMAGLAVVGRDRYGVFPLKGKLLNVREAKSDQVTKNVEITNIKQILGLRSGVQYEDASGLRYGHLMIMADQDHDGSHIKGLIINLFATFWPSLLKLPGFITEFITPIVKVTKGATSTSFFTVPEYEAWKAAGDRKGWKIKYYKGLGTSTPQEAKEYFSDIDRHKINFRYDSADDETLIELAFSKKKAAGRKDWINAFEPGTYLDQDVDEVSYSDFINKELILFSIASNVRAIPSVVDGFKPGQRKILYSCFKRNLTKEIKVAQLAGYVSEHSSYHHGEQSLAGTIVGLAQNFVGSNNINILYPSGQFGTRAEGGDDAASGRYIFTYMCPLTRLIFNPTDDNILNYLDDDGQMIEPDWYMPILPMVLVNGSSGIGTGWSTKVPPYDPREIVKRVRHKLQQQQQATAVPSSEDGAITLEALEPLVPFFKGFKGTVKLSDKKTTTATGSNYIVRGVAQKIDDGMVRISELPALKWTTSYRTDVLEAAVVNGSIISFKEHHTDTTIDFRVKMSADKLDALEKTEDGLLEYFGLIGSCSTSNMVLFDSQGKIKKYATPEAILDDFFDLRLEFYKRRQSWMEGKLISESARIGNKLRFILMVISDELKIRNVKKQNIVEQLVQNKFDALPKKATYGRLSEQLATEEDEREAALALDDDSSTAMTIADISADDNGDNENDGVAIMLNGDDHDGGHDDDDESKAIAQNSEKKGSNGIGFDYLLSMPLWSLTMERVEQLKREHRAKLSELKELRATTVYMLWHRDLDAFLVGLDEHEERERLELESGGKKKKNKGTKRKQGAPRIKTATGVKKPRAATTTKTTKTIKKTTKQVIKRQKLK